MTDPFASATTLTAALRRREIGARELLELYLQRIAKLDKEINAVVTLDEERACDEAAAADEAAARGESLGPLQGLPITVKDSLETAGIRTTCGVPELAEHVPVRDAVAVARLRAAGAIVVGKTNTPTYAGEAQTFNPIFGTTNNPWDPSRSPGGSSGGPAAAVAAGLTGLDLGSDLGGSIRMPAGYCGVFGLRPSFGVVPTRGHIPPAPMGTGEIDMSTVGPLARGATDLGLVLDVLAGPDEPMATAWGCACPRPDTTTSRVTASVPGCRTRTARWPPRSSTCSPRRWARFAGPVPPSTTCGRSRCGSRRGCSSGSANPRCRMAFPDELYAQLRQLAASDERSQHAQWARHLTAAYRDVGLADQQRQRVQAQWHEFFRDYDAVLCPITPTAAIAHDQSDGDRTIPSTVSPGTTGHRCAGRRRCPSPTCQWPPSRWA